MVSILPEFLELSQYLYHCVPGQHKPQKTQKMTDEKTKLVPKQCEKCSHPEHPVGQACGVIMNVHPTITCSVCFHACHGPNRCVHSEEKEKYVETYNTRVVADYQSPIYASESEDEKEPSEDDAPSDEEVQITTQVPVHKQRTFKKEISVPTSKTVTVYETVQKERYKWVERGQGSTYRKYQEFDGYDNVTKPVQKTITEYRTELVDAKEDYTVFEERTTLTRKPKDKPDRPRRIIG